MDDEKVQTLLRYFNAAEQLVPDANATDDSEEYSIPTAEFPAVPGYVCLTIDGQFSGDPFRRVFCGVLDGVLVAETEAVAPDLTPAVLEAKTVRPVFQRQKSHGDVILEATVSDADKRATKSNWLASSGWRSPT